MQRGEVRDPIMVTMLSVLTCGLYNIYWLYMASGELNKGLGEERFRFFTQVGLSILTCGLYAIYVHWQMCSAVAELQKRWGVRPSQDGALIFLCSLLLPPVSTFLLQQGMNNAWEHGTPGGAGGYGPGVM